MEQNQEFSIREEIQDVKHLAEAAKSLQDVPVKGYITLGALLAFIVVIKILGKKFGK